MRSPKSDSKPRALTIRQMEILQFIGDTIQRRGYAPTVREIGRHLQIKSPHGVLCHLKALEKKGYIHREANRSRAIQLIEMPGRSSKPMLRERDDGQPFEVLVGEKWLDFGFLFGTGHFVLQISGTGWNEKQLTDGDFLVLRNERVIAGDYVAAVAKPNETIVSQVIQADDELRLLVSASRWIAMRDVKILGVVVGVIRRF